MADRESTKTLRLTRKTNRKRIESTRDFPAVVFEHHFPFSNLFNSKSLFVVSVERIFAPFEKKIKIRKQLKIDPETQNVLWEKNTSSMNCKLADSKADSIEANGNNSQA
jgi:hypothetical protein